MDIMDDILSYASPSSMHGDDASDKNETNSLSSSDTSSHSSSSSTQTNYSHNISANTYSNHQSMDDSNSKLTNGVNMKRQINAIPLSQRTKVSITDIAKFVPMRLSEEERKLLVVLENALEVCEYTDIVDVTFSYTRKSKQSRIIENLIDMLSISCGLLLANNLTKGEKIVAGKTLTDNIGLFRDIFEIGRRYKIMNPSKMRNTYGKLMYILMDTESYHIKSELNIEFVKPILTVQSFLEDKGATELLSDPLLETATYAVENDMNDKTQWELEAELNRKSIAVKDLITAYGPNSSNSKLTEDDIKRVVDSISDNNSYYTFNVCPVDRMLQILVDSFDSKAPSAPEYSLELTSRPKKLFSSFSSLYSNSSSSYGSGGYSTKYYGGGSCLNHDHNTQYTFVLQSLTLWKEIMTNLPKLWFLADMDMTNEIYRLADTGQGYQRLQSCPRVSRCMSNILQRVQSRCGQWVGLSVVHLGDRDVPNALVFIDKYTQVPRILSPIVQCIERLPQLVEDKAFHRYVSEEWGSINGLRMQILSDFFKHGFDGSGDDGGSCIDGRLTSAWNWCSKLYKKPYYYVFMFTGFQGFDGDFK